MNRQQHAHPEHKKQAKHAENREEIKKEDEVALSSDDSFPASDPPSFTGVTSGEGKTKKDKH